MRLWVLDIDIIGFFQKGHRKQIHDEMVLNIKRGILFLREEKFREAEDILHLALAGARQIGEARGTKKSEAKSLYS